MILFCGKYFVCEMQKLCVERSMFKSHHRMKSVLHDGLKKQKQKTSCGVCVGGVCFQLVLVVHCTMIFQCIDWMRQIAFLTEQIIPFNCAIVVAFCLFFKGIIMVLILLLIF